MSNSKLVDYTKLSPNCNKPRNSKIKKITIHHMAGNLTVEACGDIFARTSRQASSNYGIGTDGRVGLYVDEANRSWCSSNATNDHQAITIEVANDKIGGNWHVSDKALTKLIALCVDICKRNGITKLTYTGDKTGNLTTHDMFASTACPGPYLKSKMSYIATEVNKQLAGKPVLDKTGSKLNSRDTQSFAIKRLLQIAYLLKIVSVCPTNDGLYGKTTEKAVNSLLKKWGYKQTGVAGTQFVNKLSVEIKRKIK